MAEVVEINPFVNADAVDMLRDALRKAEGGEVVACAVVLVAPGRVVMTASCKSNHYHELNSGAARLAAQLAME